MKNILIKWLGLNVLAETVADMASYTSQLPAAEEINRLLERVKELEEKVNEIEEPDMSDYITESDINDRIETYCNDYDIPNKDWIEGEIEDKVQEAIDDLGEGDKLIDRIIEEYENVQAVRIERAVENAMKKAVKPKPKPKKK